MSRFTPAAAIAVLLLPIILVRPQVANESVPAVTGLDHIPIAVADDAARTSHVREEGGRDLLPLRLEAFVADWLSRATIPVARVARVAFLAV